jgi:hypothetical protein
MQLFFLTISAHSWKAQQNVQVHFEYKNVEDRTFTTGQPNAFNVFFGPHVTAQARKAALDQCAQRLCTVFASLKSRPASIVVRTPTELPELGLGDAQQRKDLCRWAAIPPLLLLTFQFLVTPDTRRLRTFNPKKCTISGPLQEVSSKWLWCLIVQWQWCIGMIVAFLSKEERHATSIP